MPNILSFITSVRESFNGSVEVYTKGSCYQFFQILKTVFPDAIAYYDQNHVITLIDNKFYDITGEVKCTIYHKPLNEIEVKGTGLKENVFDIYKK